jgi:hypothetical protein
MRLAKYKNEPEMSNAEASFIVYGVPCITVGSDPSNFILIMYLELFLFTGCTQLAD